MTDTPFEVETSGGSLNGHSAGRGAPALLLHGGPGLPDYLEGCSGELANLFTTIRYTQRGVAPSTVGPPYSVEAHMADALEQRRSAKPSPAAADARTSSSLPWNPRRRSAARLGRS